MQKVGVYIDREEWRILFIGSTIGGEGEDAGKVGVAKLAKFLELPERLSPVKSEKILQKLVALREKPSPIRRAKRDATSCEPQSERKASEKGVL